MASRRTPRTIVRRLLPLLAAIASLQAFTYPDGSLLWSQPLSDQQLQNLIAFTRLYGYVRFFHPSDEASAVDWDKLAVYGSGRMLEARSGKELKLALHEIFSPIAPSVLIYDTDALPNRPEANALPCDTSRLVAWQHLGVALSSPSAYVSIRLHRKNTFAVVNSSGFGTISGSIQPTALRGTRITLKASAWADQGSSGHLWLRVDRPGGVMGFFDNMSDRPIVSSSWKQYEITGRVDTDAVNLSFGCMLIGEGKVWFDDLHLYSGDGPMRVEIPITNPDFESDAPGSAPQGWKFLTPGYVVSVTGETASSGKKSVAIKSARIEGPAGLFPERPALGEYTARDLPGGISCRVPLVLCADSTGPHADGIGLKRFTDALQGTLPPKLKGDQREVRLGDIVIAWNVFQHFYPYFDVTKVRWEDQLGPALQRASQDTSELEFLRTLQAFVAQLGDGHGNVALASDSSRWYFPPIQWTWAEDALVITAVSDSSVGSQSGWPAVGDVVLSVNGLPARQALENEEMFISGATPQWKRWRALTVLLSGPRGSTVKLLTKSTDGRTSASTIVRSFSRMQSYALLQRQQRPTGRVADDVFYINLSTSPMSQIDSLMPELARARGVICDLRGYPNGNHDLICHLLRAPDTSAHWMAIPKFIYPDRQSPAGFQYFGWQLQPKLPRIEGKVVFLTDGQAISYAESFMGFVEHYRLAEIVGEPTAGTNGNINPFSLPGGYRVSWTGMRVTKHDGSRHHGVGIQPTVVVHKTVQGIREGRDEQLEAAMRLIEGR